MQPQKRCANAASLPVSRSECGFAEHKETCESIDIPYGPRFLYRNPVNPRKRAFNHNRCGIRYLRSARRVYRLQRIVFQGSCRSIAMPLLAKYAFLHAE